MLDFSATATPNGHKSSIALGELGLPCRLHVLDLSNKYQKQPGFLAIPNAHEKIQPAIDRYQGESKRPLRVLDAHLKENEFLAGDYFIAGIAAFCALEFARKLMKSAPGEEGMANPQAYRDRIAQGPSA